MAHKRCNVGQRACGRLGRPTRRVVLAALPLLQRLGTRTAVRASAYFYTLRSELDRLTDALLEIAEPQHRRSEH
jgi:selenocysteine lyase/cysteine desulfurase